MPFDRPRLVVISRIENFWWPADRVARIDRLEFELLPLAVFCLLMIDLLGLPPSLRAVEA